eukprot:m.51785 g.51785  ORF g.51785 m.51785 type:complete len:418 (+) comp21500_c0_seq1:296-1549(+)
MVRTKLGHTCTMSDLQERLKHHRTQPFACHGINSSFFSEPSWDAWSLDNAAAFQQCSFKVIQPLPRSRAVGNLWTTKNMFHIDAMAKPPARDGATTARKRAKEKVKPGMAIAIEALHRVEPVRTWHRQLVSNFGIVAAAIDVYATNPEGMLPSGSYGWHMDSVDALIYVLRGRKHVRVAGYYPGSPIVIDCMVKAGSAVYVPGGFFHHVLSYSDVDDTIDTADAAADSTSDGDDLDGDHEFVLGTLALSIGLVNPNMDLLRTRMTRLNSMFFDKGMMWPEEDLEPPMMMGVDLPSEPMSFADVNAFDAQGHTALHRRVLSGDVNHVTMLLQFSNPDLEVRTRDGHSRTALGVALCCTPETMLTVIVDTLLRFHAQTDNVAIDTDTGAPSSAQHVLQTRGLLQQGAKPWWETSPRSEL